MQESQNFKPSTPKDPLGDSLDVRGARENLFESMADKTLKNYNNEDVFRSSTNSLMREARQVRESYKQSQERFSDQEDEEEKAVE